MIELWPSKWYCVVWGILGFLVLFSGVVSGNVVTMVVGVIYTSMATSAFLMYYVESEHRVKRVLEVVFVMIAFGVSLKDIGKKLSLIKEVSPETKREVESIFKQLWARSASLFR